MIIVLALSLLVLAQIVVSIAASGKLLNAAMSEASRTTTSSHQGSLVRN